MKLQRVLIAVLIATGSSAAFSATPTQVFASVAFVEPNGNAAGQDFVVSEVSTFVRVGHEQSCPVIVCSASTRTFKAVTLFSGYLVEDKLDGSSVVLTVKKYAADVPPASAYDQSTTCRSVLPSQRVLLNQTYHLQAGISDQVILLPDGSTMKYSISGQSS